jgi:muconolactone delta-isomerase
MALVFGLCISALQTGIQKNPASAGGVAIFPAGARPVGYKLGLLATACSMGGVWSDAEGVPPADWRTRDDQRCKDLVASVYGQFEPARYEQLRAGDAQALSDLLAKIRATEPAASRDRTVALFRDVTAAMHEGMLARRAADRVKVDYDADAVEAKLTADERTAAKALSQHGALERLLVTTDTSASDRRVIGLLLAMDRMEMARGLPKQLKFYALGHVLTTVFDAPPPPADALKPTATPRPGTWLAYLSGVAARVGHPASDSPALTNKMRETLAWTGVGYGFADRLRAQAATLPNAAVPELSRIATEVAARLESERATAEKMSKAHAPSAEKK